MNVLNVLSGREHAGIRSYVLSISEGLKNKNLIFSFVVLGSGPLFNDFQQMGFQVFLVKKKFRFDISVITRLAKIIKKENIDIIHTHNVTSNFYGRLASLLAGRGFVVTTVHANVFDEHISSFGSKFIGNVISTIDLYMVRLSKRLITISDYLRNVLIEKGISENKVVTVLSSITIDQNIKGLSCDKKNIYEETGIKNDEKVVGTVGRLVPLKNFKMFIDAARIVLEKGLRTRFIIIGDGVLFNELSDYVNDLGLSKQVIFLGWQKQLKEFYPLMDVYVTCPTSEGLGLTPLEAMSFSIPVIATNVGGLPEVVKDDKTGMLVKSDDANALAEAIACLLENPSKAKEMGQAGRELLEEKFTVSKAAENIYSVYKSVLRNNASALVF